MRRRVLTAGLLLAAGSLAASAAEPLRPSDFQLRLPLAVARKDGLHVVELNEAVYRASAYRHLADLRVFNANGESLAWALLPALAPETRTSAPIELALVPLPEDTSYRALVIRSYSVRIERDARSESVEIAPLQPVELPPGGIGGYLIDARRAKDRSGQLMLVFDAAAPDYAQTIDIAGSDDLVRWRPVLNGSLTLNRKLDAPVERTTFDVSRPPPFLRVQWTGPAPQLTGARFVERRVETVTLPRTALPLRPDADRPDSLLADVPTALPIERLLFRPAAINESYPLDVDARTIPKQRVRRHFLSHRRVDEWTRVARVEVTHVVRGGTELTGAPLPFSFATDRLRLTPVAGSTLMLPPQVEAEWRPARIAFIAKAPGPYFIAIGRADTPAPAPLDIAALLPADDRVGRSLPGAFIGTSAADELVVKAAERQRSERIAAQAHWSRYALWAALVAAVAALAWMAWRLSVQLKRQSP